MPFADQTLKCKDCGKDFVWTASEQDFYQQKGFQNSPVRCPDCRKAKKEERLGSRQWFTITCAKCGAQDQVPFEPRGDKPVLCKKCFAESKGESPRPEQTRPTEIPVEKVENVPVEEAAVAEVPVEVPVEEKVEESKPEEVKAE